MQTPKLLTTSMLFAAFAAAQPCSTADVRGRYLFRTWGTHDFGPSHPDFPNTAGPAYGQGVVDLDGAGKGTGKLNMTYGGVAQSLEFLDFQYSVAEDCTGTAQYRLKVTGAETVLGPDKLEVRLLDDGARLRGVLVESGGRGASMAAEFRRLGRGAQTCYPSMLRGAYTMHLDGFINMRTVNPNFPAAFSSFFGVGSLIFDPETGNRGSTAQIWGSLRLWTDLLAATWNLKADCTGLFEFTMQPRGTSNRISAMNPFVASDDGARIDVLMISPPGLQSYERVSIP